MILKWIKGEGEDTVATWGPCGDGLPWPGTECIGCCGRYEKVMQLQYWYRLYPKWNIENWKEDRVRQNQRMHKNDCKFFKRTYRYIKKKHRRRMKQWKSRPMHGASHILHTTCMTLPYVYNNNNGSLICYFITCIPKGYNLKKKILKKKNG